MIIERVALPGVGVCHTATTTRRQRVGVVRHHSGRRDVLLYDPDDPQRAAHTVVLDAIEADQVADLLIAAVTVDHVPNSAGPAHSAGGVAIARVPIPAGSPHDSRTLHDIGVDVLLDVSVVAAIRDGRVVPVPGAEFVLRHGDTLIVAGEHTAVAGLTELLAGGAFHRPALAALSRTVR